MTVDLDDLILIRSDVFPGEFVRDDTGKRVKLEEIDFLKESAPIIVQIEATPSGRHAYSLCRECTPPERANALLLGEGYSVKDHLVLTINHIIYAGVYCVLNEIRDSNSKQPREDAVLNC